MIAAMPQMIPTIDRITDRARGGGNPTRKQQHRNRALGHVEREDQQSDLRSENSNDVRRAEVARSVLAEIDAFRFAGDVRRGNRPEEIRGDDRGDERPGAVRAAGRRCRRDHPALRRMTMRSGFPVKPQKPRNPLCR